MIILTVGLPGSGKSTWAKKHCNQFPNFKRVNKDDLRAMVGGKHSNGRENFILGVQTAFITQAVELGYDVVVDDTNLHPKHYERISRIFKGEEIQIKLFTADPATCIQRDMRRVGDAHVGKKVILDMAANTLKWAEGNKQWTTIIQPLISVLQVTYSPTCISQPVL